MGAAQGRLGSGHGAAEGQPRTGRGGEGSLEPKVEFIVEEA